MTPKPLGALLADLSAQGVRLQARGDRLRFRPRSAVTPDLAGRLRAHKDALLAILQGGSEAAVQAQAIIRRVRASGEDDLAEAMAEAWEERLAICTADGGLTLAQAEVIALYQLKAMLDFSTSTHYT
jgi:hypothetical protein